MTWHKSKPKRMVHGVWQASRSSLIVDICTADGRAQTLWGMPSDGPADVPVPVTTGDVRSSGCINQVLSWLVD